MNQLTLPRSALPGASSLTVTVAPEPSAVGATLSTAKVSAIFLPPASVRAGVSTLAMSAIGFLSACSAASASAAALSRTMSDVASLRCG